MSSSHAPPEMGERMPFQQDYLVVDAGAWIFGRTVLLPAGVVERIDTVEHKVYVDRTKDQIKAAPEYDQTVDDATYRERLGGEYADTDQGPAPPMGPGGR